MRLEPRWVQGSPALYVVQGATKGRCWCLGPEISRPIRILVPGAESQTAALAKIGVGSSAANGVLTMDAAKGPVFAVLTKA
jgi:hypothetical protein